MGLRGRVVIWGWMWVLTIFQSNYLCLLAVVKHKCLDKSLNHVVFFFWGTVRRLNFIYRRFETLCLFHFHMSCKEEELPIQPNEVKVLTGGGVLARRSTSLCVGHSCVWCIARLYNRHLNSNRWTCLRWRLQSLFERPCSWYRLG